MCGCVVHEVFNLILMVYFLKNKTKNNTTDHISFLIKLVHCYNNSTTTITAKFNYLKKKKNLFYRFAVTMSVICRLWEKLMKRSCAGVIPTVCPSSESVLVRV